MLSTEEKRKDKKSKKAATDVQGVSTTISQSLRNAGLKQSEASMEKSSE